jgi:hypothetical protein
MPESVESLNEWQLQKSRKACARPIVVILLLTWTYAE